MFRRNPHHTLHGVDTDVQILHADHGIGDEQKQHIINVIASAVAPNSGFFIKEFTLPDFMAPIPNALYGPAAGDAPVQESEVHYARRGNRTVEDRMVSSPVRPVRYGQAIGMWTGDVLKFFTIYGGPLAPMHPDDPNNRDPEGARAWWSQHALSDQQWKGNPRRRSAPQTMTPFERRVLERTGVPLSQIKFGRADQQTTGSKVAYDPITRILVTYVGPWEYRDDDGVEHWSPKSLRKIQL